MEGGEAAGDLSYVAVRSRDGHYSIWPAGREVPAGWTRCGGPGSREECLDLVEAAWEDPVLRFQPPEGS